MEIGNRKKGKIYKLARPSLVVTSGSDFKLACPLPSPPAQAQERTSFVCPLAGYTYWSRNFCQLLIHVRAINEPVAAAAAAIVRADWHSPACDVYRIEPSGI